jgi:hypothetical protein
MPVTYLYSDDILSRSKEALHRAIGQYASRSRWIYIGLTQQRPEVRFNQHQGKWAAGHKWDRMVVIYHARSFGQMQRTEEELMNYARAKIKAGNYACEIINERKSQAPRMAASPDGYWVYLLTQA